MQEGRDYYKLILDSINKDFKTSKQIALETNIPVNLVITHIKRLRRRNEIIFIQGLPEKTRGVKPLMYKAL